MVNRPSSLAAIVCGILFGLIALTGNAGLSLGGAFVVAVALSPLGFRAKVTTFAIVGLATLLVAAPWMIRNHRVLGKPVLNTNGGFNLYLGNNPAATGRFVSIADTPRADSWEDLRQEGEVHASDMLRQEAVDWIKENPAKFSTLAVKKLFYFWSPSPLSDSEKPSKVDTLARILIAVQLCFVTFLAVCGLAIRRNWNRRMVVIWLAIAGYASVHMLFYVISRYRLPIMPAVCVLAAITIETIVDGRKNRSSVSAGACDPRKDCE